MAYQNLYTNSFAIIIGIDSYANERLIPLGKAEEDSQNIAAVLEGEPYHFKVSLLLGQKATRSAITRALGKLVNTGEDDRIIFYFAGHGYVMADMQNNDVGYLACVDTDPDDPYDGLEYDEVTKIRRFAKAKHIAFILDACFSGAALGLTRAAIQPAAISEYLTHRAYQVLTAGAVEVVSDARSMTGELVRALRDGIPGREGALTFGQVGQHIHDIIHAQSKGLQSPVCQYLEGSGKGQMVLLTPAAVDLLPADLRTGLTHPEALMRRFAIAEAEKRLADPAQAEKVRAALADMQLDDPDRDVRRRAAEALRAAPLQTAPPQPAPEVEAASERSSHRPAAGRPQPEKAVAKKPAPAAGDPITSILPEPFEWCPIPAGQVTLDDSEGAFEVKPFNMAKYPITYAQFQVFVDAADGFRDDRWWQGLAKREAQPGVQNWKIENHPRENVSWYDAVAFCRWLSAKAGYEVRLPAEWEWQWAAQGPDGRTYPWGNEYIQGYANMAEKGSKVKGGVSLQKTTPVGSYPKGASPYGVLDMAGNVWEWCLNEYDHPAKIDLAGDARRVVRGGSWHLNQPLARSAYRGGDLPDGRNDLVGFRVVGFGPVLK